MSSRCVSCCGRLLEWLLLVASGQAPGFLVQDAGSGAKGTNGAAQMTLQLVDGKFRDSRWQEGRWVLDNFKDNSGSMDWDKVSM